MKRYKVLNPAYKTKHTSTKLLKKLQPESRKSRTTGSAITKTTKTRSRAGQQQCRARAHPRASQQTRTPSTEPLHRRIAAGSRPPPGTDPRCPQTEKRHQGSSTREEPEASLADDRQTKSDLRHTTIGEPRAVRSTMSSRRARHRNAATARSEDLGFSPGGSRETGLASPRLQEGNGVHGCRRRGPER
jgi:hypothetical protein